MKYTNEELENAVKLSHNYCETCRNLKIKHRGGSYDNLKRRIKRLNIDISHFDDSYRRTIRPVKVSVDEILTYNESKSDRTPRNQLLRAMLAKGKIYICNSCGINDNWNNKKLTLEIDHINRNWKDNRVENLRFLCPNCHSQV